MNTQVCKDGEQSFSYWLVFPKADQGNREECNVYYSDLVYCQTKDEAKLIIDPDYSDSLDVIRMKLHTKETIDSENSEDSDEE